MSCKKDGKRQLSDIFVFCVSVTYIFFFLSFVVVLVVISGTRFISFHLYFKQGFAIYHTKKQEKKIRKEEILLSLSSVTRLRFPLFAVCVAAEPQKKTNKPFIVTALLLTDYCRKLQKIKARRIFFNILSKCVLPAAFFT